MTQIFRENSKMTFQRFSLQFVVVLLLIFCLARIDGAEKHRVSSKSYLAERHSKFWSFLGVGLVRFQNGVCNTTSGLSGTCYTRRQCREVSGTAAGRCAQNIGVCCVIQYSCGSTSSYNNTYFVSTNYPSRVTGSSRCVYTIKKCNSDICQVRIDFVSATLAQPDGDGNCINDRLVITGGGSQVPILCGENTGQHVYMDFYGDQDIIITASTSSSLALGRNWNFRVTQIACACPTRAPSGCLMYYTGVTGTVQSFNYGSTASTSQNSLGMTGTRQLVNQNYGICVAMEPGYCSIVWRQSAMDSFTVSNDTEAVDVGTPSAGFEGPDCLTDFVVVPAPYISGTLHENDRFCGNYFPTMTTYSKPFVLTVVNNGNESGDSANKGFSLDYTQQRCTNT